MNFVPTSYTGNGVRGSGRQGTRCPQSHARIDRHDQCHNLFTEERESRLRGRVRGLRRIAECENLPMDHVCDETSNLQPKGFMPDVKDHSVVQIEKKECKLTEEQLEEIGKVLDAYDCRAWQHLLNYQNTGKVRILCPNDHMFDFPFL